MESEMNLRECISDRNSRQLSESNRFDVNKISKLSDVEALRKEAEHSGEVFNDSDFVYIKKVKNQFYVIGYDKNESTYYDGWYGDGSPLSDNLTIGDVKERIKIANS